MRYEGIVYRPPSEARSLIVQVTIGCAHNTCTFCNMYKAKDFRVRSMEEIMEDLKEAHNSYGAYVQKVFLADGDALVLQTEKLLEILEKGEEADLLTSYLQEMQWNDATNREGHAAKVYFNALFGMDFTRTADTSTNAALNYGYGIILSCFNREIAANGYITQIGLFHDNMFNQLNLACDLMEPFRILVDRQVCDMELNQFDKEEKLELVDILNHFVYIDGNKESVYSKMALNQTAASGIVDKVKKNKPPEGLVQLMTVTEKQYNRMEYISGEFSSEILCTDERLVVF